VLTRPKRFELLTPRFVVWRASARRGLGRARTDALRIAVNCNSLCDFLAERVSVEVGAFRASMATLMIAFVECPCKGDLLG
jgi:hypothetical protein